MSESNGGDAASKKAGKSKLSRRTMFRAMAGAAAAVPLVAQAQQPPAPGAQAPGRGAGAPGRGGGGRGNPQGGVGPVKVLFISSYHPFDRENLFVALDSMGQDISWTHVEHPAAEAFYDPQLAAPFDVLLFYDAFAGRQPGANGSRMSGQDAPPSARTQANLKALLQAGNKGLVFFHHSVASWAHTWPAGVNGTNAYSEMIGGVADWGTPLKNVRGKDYPPSGFKIQPQRITVVDKAHPITAGIEDFDLVDESYLWPVFEDSVHPLLRTNAVQTAENYRPQQAGHPQGSSLTAWYKAAERSPVVYIQHGHNNDAWTNPNWKRLMTNAIKWAASPEAKAWARANQKRIFV
jgi:type 1 glutamine amidotransferase